MSVSRILKVVLPRLAGAAESVGGGGGTDTHGRLGAIECLYRLIGGMGLSILPYSVFLVSKEQISALFDYLLDQFTVFVNWN